MTTKAFGDVELTLDGEIAVLTLSHGEHNTLDPVTALELAVYLESVDREHTARCIVITAAGSRFCTGADLASASAALPPQAIDRRHGYDPYTRLFKALWSIEVPVVSIVNGAVAGVGWMLALLADFVVADERARWTHMFSRLGMAAHAGDPYYLTRILPLARIAQIAMLDEAVTSRDLASWGAIYQAVPAEELRQTGMELAARLADGPTRSIGMTKQLYRRGLDQTLDASLEYERTAIALLSTTHDRAEGPRAFQEHRRPKFLGE